MATMRASLVYSRIVPLVGITAGVVGRLDPKWPPRQIGLENGFPLAIRSEPLRLLAHQVHQVRPHDSVGKTREIVDGGGQRQLPSRLFTLEYQGREVGPGGIKCRGQARRTRPDDDDCCVRLRHGPLSRVGRPAAQMSTVPTQSPAIDMVTGSITKSEGASTTLNMASTIQLTTRGIPLYGAIIRGEVQR